MRARLTRTQRIGAAFGAVAAVAVTVGSCDFLRGYASGRSAGLGTYENRSLPPDRMGAVRFVFGDFGALNTDTLETNAIPWKLVATALVVERWPGERPTPEHLREVLTGYGFIYPKRIGNWPDAEQPQFRTPLGIVSGQVTRSIPPVQVEVANLGCAACHSGVTYDAAGNAQPVAWLGLPNTSLDLDAYVDGVLSALRTALPDRDRLLDQLTELFPETSERELKTLRRFVWPRMAARLSAGGGALPFRNGGPGRSNGVAALKYQFGLPQASASLSAGVSIPDLADQSLRWSLLADGIYTRVGDPRFTERSTTDVAAPERLAEIIAFFTVPTMGLHPDRAVDAIGAVGDVMHYLAAYRSPPFPGAIDRAVAARGAIVYRSKCAECHGTYSERDGRLRLATFPNRRSDLQDIGSDASRVESVDAGVIAAVAHSPMGRYIDAAQTGGYVAPSLTSVWATAPYLHNGSVPTLWHLLHPEARPERFQVGGHKLDFMLLGIAGELDAARTWTYPPGFEPWSTPHIFDARRPGHSNRGHEREFSALSEDEKHDLLEFLKQL